MISGQQLAARGIGAVDYVDPSSCGDEFLEVEDEDEEVELDHEKTTVRT